jgi:hypothetical protein
MTDHNVIDAPKDVLIDLTKGILADFQREVTGRQIAPIARRSLTDIHIVSNPFEKVALWDTDTNNRDSRERARGTEQP